MGSTDGSERSSGEESTEPEFEPGDRSSQELVLVVSRLETEAGELKCEDGEADEVESDDDGYSPVKQFEVRVGNSDETEQLGRAGEYVRTLATVGVASSAA